MTTESLYNLTWGEYGASLVSAVQLLRYHDELVDVTLAAGGRTFHAHKVVLCAASPFLLDLLKDTTCAHPVVMLAGIQASDVEAILEFVYRGEVSVDPTQLPSLLQAAHCLNIQGLSPSTIALNNTNLQPNMKHDIGQAPDVPQQTAAIVPGTNEPGAKKKRHNRKSSTSPAPNKWAKIELAENVISNQDDCSNSWSQHSTTSLSTTGNESQSLFFHSMPLSVGLQSKAKSASDQPGTCPLCGAMLRQARNLRRHLITSCKYRIMTSHLLSTNTTSTTSTITQSGLTERMQAQPLQHQAQASQLNVQMNQNSAQVDCNSLLPTTSNLLNLQ